MKKESTHTKLLKTYIDEALILLLGKKGFAEITIKEITEKAGVNRSTYYRNFNSKEDIVMFFYSSILTKCISKQTPQTKEAHLLNVFN